MEENVKTEIEIDTEAEALAEEAEEIVIKPRRKRPAISKKFDIETAFFTDKEDEEPRFKYNLKGSFKVDLLRLFAVLLTVFSCLTAISLLTKKK